MTRCISLSNKPYIPPWFWPWMGALAKSGFPARLWPSLRSRSDTTTTSIRSSTPRRKPPPSPPAWCQVHHMPEPSGCYRRPIRPSASEAKAKANTAVTSSMLVRDEQNKRLQGLRQLLKQAANQTQAQAQPQTQARKQQRKSHKPPRATAYSAVRHLVARLLRQRPPALRSGSCITSTTQHRINIHKGFSS